MQDSDSDSSVNPSRFKLKKRSARAGVGLAYEQPVTHEARLELHAESGSRAVPGRWIVGWIGQRGSCVRLGV